MNSSVIVCDTSSLIRLYKGGVLDLLEKLFEKIYIPLAVKAECQTPTIQVWINNQYCETLSVQRCLFESLGLGEREAISLAVELSFEKSFKKLLIITDCVPHIDSLSLK